MQTRTVGQDGAGLCVKRPGLILAAILVVAILAGTAPLLASVETTTTSDEIEGTSTYLVRLRAAKNSTEWLSFGCNKNGQVSFMWVLGSRRLFIDGFKSALFVTILENGTVIGGDYDLIYRVDDAPAVATTLVAISSREGVRLLIERLAQGKALLLKAVHWDEASRFDLKGFAQAVGPGTGFHGQCLSR